MFVNQIDFSPVFLGLGTSLRTCSKAAAGGHYDRRIKGRSRYSPCLKKL
jgi:hypothetical protein